MPRLHGIKVTSKPIANKIRPGVKKRFNDTNLKGYPGLVNTAREITQYIPKCKLFVEPFAGLGRIGKLVKADEIVLNDLSDFAVKYLRGHFLHEITQVDYLDCIYKHDSPGTFLFIDPPWFDQIYENNELTINTKPCRQIYQELEKLLPTLKSDWMIAGSTEGPLPDWKLGYQKEIKSKKKKIFGYFAKTFLRSNLPFINYWQKQLEF